MKLKLRIKSAVCGIVCLIVLFALLPGLVLTAQEGNSSDPEAVSAGEAVTSDSGAAVPDETPAPVDAGAVDAPGAAVPDETPVPADAGAVDASGAAFPETEAAPVDEANSAAPAVKAPDEKQLNILRYGTETEIAALIQTLKTGKDPSLDAELIQLVQVSKNKTILSGIFSFFGEMEKPGLEERATRVIRERNDEANETVQAAVDYLGKIKFAGAVPVLEELINSGESRFLNAAIRALGRAGRGEETGGGTAQYLLKYYDEGNPNSEDQREIIVALGEAGAAEAVPFLSDLIRNSEARMVLRMAALDAMAKIGDPAGLDAVIEAVSASDPNVRSSAIAALGPFPGDAADKAILDGFRDSYYRTRIGAAAAAGKRKLEVAVPYLRFRAENDDVPAAKDEAIKALGAIGNSEAMAILDSLFSERKNSDRVRILAGEMLLLNDAPGRAPIVIAELEDAKNRKQTPLYNGFLRILGPSLSPSLEDLAKRFLASGTVIEKSYALDMTVNNEFRGLADDVRQLLDEKKNGASLSRKARSALDKLGLE
jgi:HEAT repeat protein